MTDATRLALPRPRARFSSDILLTTCGCTVAAASIAFAGYMLAFGPKELRPRMRSEFGVFASFDHRPGFTTTHGSRTVAADDRAVPVQARAAQGAAGVDFSPTGSVAAPDARSASGPDARPVAEPLPGYILRDVFDGAAVIQSRDRLSVVRPGSYLAGAGAVRAIEQDGRDWVVLTDRGTIVRQAPTP